MIWRVSQCCVLFLVFRLVGKLEFLYNGMYKDNTFSGQGRFEKYTEQGTGFRIEGDVCHFPKGCFEKRRERLTKMTDFSYQGPDKDNRPRDFGCLMMAFVRSKKVPFPGATLARSKRWCFELMSFCLLSLLCVCLG